MLRNTFRHLPSVGARGEAELWAAGLMDWASLRRDGASVLGAAKLAGLIPVLDASERALALGDARYFAALLPRNEHWRIFAELRGRVAALDIETTGLSRDFDQITTVALWDGEEARLYVQGRNLAELAEDLESYGVLLTYNGTGFDLPFLRQAQGITFHQVHLDLMYLLRGLGYRGGLKACERQLGLGRDELDGVDGSAAIWLWQEFLRSRDEAVLETLLAYNLQDVVGLETLMVRAYNLKLSALPGAPAPALPLPPPASLPVKPHAAVLRRLRQCWH